MCKLCPLKKRVRILGLPRIMSGNAYFVLLVKVRITRKKINLPKLFFIDYVRAGTSSLLQCFIWLKSKTVKMYSVVISVKLLLVLNILTWLRKKCFIANKNITTFVSDVFPFISIDTTSLKLSIWHSKGHSLEF